MILAGVAILYVAAHLSWYSATPLGMQPVLDGREILGMVQAMAENRLPPDAFYRAPLYPASLSLLAKAGLAPRFLPVAARWFNGVCHLASAALVFCIAFRIWRTRRAAWLACMLFALNPVVLHFVGDPFDITFAITLFLGGLFFAVGLSSPDRQPIGRNAFWDAMCAGGFMALAALTRPQMLPVVLAWPFWILLVRRDYKAMAGSIAAAGCVLGIFGLINLEQSGRFVILPTQGSYNLWAANRPGAHGRYFVHVTPVTGDDEANPSRIEAEILFLRETGRTPPVDDAEMNRYWRHKFFLHIRQEPLSWIRQMIGKAYALLNDYEQYNNKTYFLHKARSPWLRFNPLGWSWMLFLGAVGAVMGRKRAEVWTLLAMAMLYAAGVLLFFVSARFRLPLVPLLAIMAGGLLSADSKKPTAWLLVPLALTALSLTSLGNTRNTSTVFEDHLLMGRAALAVGQDAEAYEHARAAMALQPSRSEARAVLALARYNMLLADLPDLPSRKELEADLEHVQTLRDRSDDMLFIQGVYLWLLDRNREAVTAWRVVVDRQMKQKDQALGALLLTGYARADDVLFIQSMPDESKSDYLLLAELAAGREDARAVLARRLSGETINLQVQYLSVLFRCAGDGRRKSSD